MIRFDDIADILFFVMVIPRNSLAFGFAVTVRCTNHRALLHFGRKTDILKKRQQEGIICLMEKGKAHGESSGDRTPGF